MVVLEEKEATSDEGDTRIVYSFVTSLVKPYSRTTYIGKCSSNLIRLLESFIGL